MPENDVSRSEACACACACGGAHEDADAQAVQVSAGVGVSECSVAGAGADAPSTFIATFFSHFGTMRFKKACDALGIPARTMPVPRNLSSSCGTCTKFECVTVPSYEEHKDELESIVRVTDGGYETVYHADGEEA